MDINGNYQFDYIFGITGHLTSIMVIHTPAHAQNSSMMKIIAMIKPASINECNAMNASNMTTVLNHVIVR